MLDAAKMACCEAEAYMVRAQGCQPFDAATMKQHALTNMREARADLDRAMRATEDEIFGPGCRRRAEEAA
jgi:hypothetical protein